MPCLYEVLEANKFPLQLSFIVVEFDHGFFLNSFEKKYRERFGNLRRDNLSSPRMWEFLFVFLESTSFVFTVVLDAEFYFYAHT